MENSRDITITDIRTIYIKNRKVGINIKNGINRYFVELKSLMARRAGNFSDRLRNHINHYGITQGVNDGSRFMVRKGETGETAHMIFSWLIWYIPKKWNFSYVISFEQGNQQRSETLLERQRAALMTLPDVFINEDETVKLKMEAYNNGPLAMMCRTGMRRRIRRLLMHEDFGIHSFVRQHIIPAAREITRQANPQSHPIVVWYRKPKNENDKGRMDSIYRVLDNLQCRHIIWMGDAPDEHTKCKLRDVKLYKIFDPELLYRASTAISNISCTFLTANEMPGAIQNNLLYQWILCAQLTNSLRSVMLCPSRTGGSHGPYLLGTPLVYFDEFNGKTAFLQERMAIHALIDDLLTPVPFPTGGGNEDITASETMMQLAVERYLALQQNGDEDIFRV